MNNLNDKYHLVYYLNQHFYLFELESTGNLIYKVFTNDMKLVNKYTISSKIVINFNVALDNKRIILIYLLKSGELNLCINDGLSWTEAQIGKLDTMSNMYHQFELLFTNNKINLIYSYSNYINSEIISIQHLVLDKKLDEQNNVIKYILRKGYNEFSVDFDEMGTIHLIYNTTTNFESYIYHSFYSPYRGLWSSNPKELSSRGKENSMPYLFVDSKSNVNTTWLELDNNIYKLKYAKMPVNGKDKYIWQNINIPITFNNNFTPLIYEEDNLLKILSYDLNSITTLISSDYGSTWSNKGDKQISNINKFIRFTKSNDIHPKLKVKDALSKSLKVNDLNDLYFDFGITNNNKIENIVNPLHSSQNISEIKIDEEIPEDVQYNIEDNEVKNPNKILVDKDELRELLYEIIDQEKLSLDEILENEKNILFEINELKRIIVEAKPSLLNKFFK